jgi:hypothetical protein
VINQQQDIATVELRRRLFLLYAGKFAVVLNFLTMQDANNILALEIEI